MVFCGLVTGLGGRSVGRPSSKLQAHTRVSVISPAVLSKKELEVRKQYISGMLGLSYLGTIVSVMTLPSVLSLVDKTLFIQRSTLSLSQLLFGATMGTVAGKFLLGPPTDKLGGHNVLKFCLLANTLFLYLCSNAASPSSFALPWLLVSFLYGSTWGAVGAVVRRDFTKEEWGKQLGYTAAWSRVGSLGSSLVFGAIMSRLKGDLNSWRVVFQAAAGIQALILLAYFAVGSKIILPASSTSSSSSSSSSSQFESKEADNETAVQLLSRVGKTSEFWGMIFAKASLLGVGQMISFFALYLETGIGLSASAASSASGLFALGSLSANLVGSNIYHSLQRSTRINGVTASNIVGVVIPLLLYAHAIKLKTVAASAGTAAATLLFLPAPAILALLTVWGLAWGFAFYIPPGIIALRLGGKRHAALITNLADGVGFFVAAVFSLFAMEPGRRGAWSGVMLTLASFTTVALCALRHAMGKEKEKE